MPGENAPDDRAIDYPLALKRQERNSFLCNRKAEEMNGTQRRRRQKMNRDENVKAHS